MNIAINYESVVPAKGGLEMYIGDLIRRLRQDQHQIHLYACDYAADALPEGVVHHPLAPVRGPRFLRPWRFAAQSEAALRQHRHDVILGFNKTWYQDVYLPGGGLHVASADHNLRKYRLAPMQWLAKAGKWFDPCYWSYRILEKKQFLGPYQPIVIAVSRMVQRHFLTYYGLHDSRVRVIPNAINPDRFEAHDRLLVRAELRRELAIAPEENVGLFIGHNYRLKGLEPLLRAVRLLRHHPFRLLVCGQKNAQKYIRMVQRLGIRDKVIFMGYRSDVRTCFFASDFLVHPSFYDPCALVTLEALACGLPVITSIYNGGCELLPPPMDQFTLVDPHDAQSLALNIKQLCVPQVRAECTRAARKAAAAWTFEDHYRQLLEVFEEAAARKAAA